MLTNITSKSELTYVETVVCKDGKFYHIEHHIDRTEELFKAQKGEDIVTSEWKEGLPSGGGCFYYVDYDKRIILDGAGNTCWVYEIKESMLDTSCTEENYQLWVPKMQVGNQDMFSWLQVTLPTVEYAHFLAHEPELKSLRHLTENKLWDSVNRLKKEFPDIKEETKGEMKRIIIEIIDSIREWKPLSKETSENAIGTPNIEPLLPAAVATGDAFLSEVDIRNSDNRVLIHYHDTLHKWDKAFGAKGRDERAKNHSIVVDEMRRRKLDTGFNSEDPLDILSVMYREDYPEAWLSELVKEGKYSVQAHWYGKTIHYDLSFDTGLKVGFEKWAVINNPLKMKVGEATLVVKRSICREPRWFSFSGVIRPNDPREWLRGGNPSKNLKAYVKVIDRGRFKRVDNTSTLKGQIMSSKKGGLKGRYILQKGPEGKWLLRRTKVPEDSKGE